ncbi:serine hydrolase domain-containing protein [Actinoplanes sp. NPDC051861]|uniref:serine hydrolase domain-containing protein n=1 Tax=Actinoplanes sp. NPDC051861 TaxID=3155170 RepID=UPI00341DD06E
MNDIAQRVAAFCETTGVPGFVAGLHRAGEQSVVAHGLANITTGAPMRPDTGFLFGSITKIMTTTLVLRHGIDLNARVVDLLPEFRLSGEIRVEHLLTHTSGIDADLFFPDACGPGALATYVDRLGRECGMLFEPGEYVSYSNGGMIVAGRLLEVVTGLPYADLLVNLFTGAGMTNSCTSAAEALLRPTAIGHFPDPATGEVRPTSMFMLPETWGPAGATPIGTVTDLLAFGRLHLDPSAPVALMRSVKYDLGTPNASPVGLGWLVRTLNGRTVLTMSGASPGGVAVLAVMPDDDLVLAAYGNDPRALELHDELLHELAGGVATPSYERTPADLRPYAGTYRSNQLRVEVRVDGDALEERVFYEPADASQERIFTGFVGGSFSSPPTRYVPVGKDLFAPEALPLDAVPSHYLVSYHGGAAYRCAGGRMTRRV